MKNVYLDINGDIIDAIFAIEPQNRIDKILADIADITGIEPLKGKKVKSKSKDKEKKKSKKHDILKEIEGKEKFEGKTRIVKIKRIK